MKSKITTTIIMFLMIFTGALVYAPTMAHADFKSDACEGVNTLNGSTSSACPTGSGAKIGNIVKMVIQVLSIVVGFIAVIMVIVGGLKLITANGDSGAVASGRNAIIYALIGLVIVAFAQLLVHFVIFKTSDLQSTNKAPAPQQQGDSDQVFTSN